MPGINRPSRKKNRGNPMVSFRCPPELLAQLRRYVAAADQTNRDGGVTLNGFVVKAVAEKLAHLKRSKRTRRPVTAGDRAAAAALAALAPARPVPSPVPEYGSGESGPTPL